jgi:crotonobetainyl-CoA:carnitine CoA-transferase CaiB-like acyl-CoA transferase
MAKPLEGVRVLEVALYAYVPSAGAILAEWGADVIKVEHPRRPDPMRGTAAWDIPPGFGGFTYMWEVCNRGKRGIAVDIGNEEGREVVLKLVDQADVFLTNFLPEARQKLRIDVEDIMERNPRIVYGRGSGQGPVGPDALEGGFDGLTFWSRGGVSAALTPPGSPHPVRMAGPGFGDVQSGALLAGGVAAGLFQRDKTGDGVVVDGSLLASGMWAMQPTIVASNLTGAETLPIAAHDQIGNPLTNNYRTSDDRYVTLGLLESDRFWPGLCEVLGVPELAADVRFNGGDARAENRAALTAILDEIFARHTLAEWREILRRQEGPWTSVQYPSEVARDPQAEANGYVQDVDYGDGRQLRLVSAPIQFGATPGRLTPAPHHGADTEHVLEEMGYAWEDISRLKESGAII